MTYSLDDSRVPSAPMPDILLDMQQRTAALDRAQAVAAFDELVARVAAEAQPRRRRWFRRRWSDDSAASLLAYCDQLLTRIEAVRAAIAAEEAATARAKVRTLKR